MEGSVTTVITTSGMSGMSGMSGGGACGGAPMAPLSCSPSGGNGALYEPAGVNMPPQMQSGRQGEKQDTRGRRKNKGKGGGGGGGGGGGVDRMDNRNPMQLVENNGGIMPPGLACVNGSAMGGSGSQAGMMAQQYAPPGQQFYVSPAMTAMPYYSGCGHAAGVVYHPPAAGMYQPTGLYQPQPGGHTYQPQQFVQQQPQYVPQQPQQYMAQQTGSAAQQYAYQQPGQLAMSGAPGMGGGGFSSHGGQGFGGYDDSTNAYDTGQGALGAYPSSHQGYYRSS